MSEINLDKKTTNLLSYVKLWLEVAPRLAVRKDVRFGLRRIGRFV